MTLSGLSTTGVPLFDEWPYAYVLFEGKADAYCHYCLSSKRMNQAKLQRCSRCKFAYYCNRNCQMAAHKDHKEECLCLERCQGYIPSTRARIIARIIFKKSDTFEPDPHLPDDLQKRHFKDLMNHKADIVKDKKRMEEFRIICHELDRYLCPEHWVTDDELLDFFGKLVINSFNIWVQDVSLAIALGLYVGASILDHSCDPDVFSSFEGPRIVIRPFRQDLGNKSLKHLRLGYFGNFFTTRKRQDLSSFRYYFNCDCHICKDKLRDREMRSVRCEHCSGVALFGESDASDFIATCQSCAKTTDGFEANDLMEKLDIALEHFGSDPEAVKEWYIALERFGSDPEAVKEWRNLKSIPEDLATLDHQALTLLSDINIYSSSLSMKLQGLCNVANLNTEAFKHCLRALKAVQHFLHPNDPLLLMQLKSAGIVLTEKLSTADEGIKLLLEAEKGYKFIDDVLRAQECRSIIRAVRDHKIGNGNEEEVQDDYVNDVV